MKKILFFLICASCFSVQAQQRDSSRPRLHSVNSIGIMSGSKGLAYSLQTVLGVEIRKTFVGVGAGIDDYSFRSVPMFLDVRQEFGHEMRNLFVYADGGYNVPWLTDKDRNAQRQQYGDNKFRGGFYLEPGFGYNIHFRNEDILLLSVGYSYKVMKDHVTSNGCSLWGCGTTVPVTYNYHMQRLAIRAGYRF